MLISMETRIIEYVDLNTGDITEIKSEAVLWYRTGSDIDVLLNGVRVALWVH